MSDQCCNCGWIGADSDKGQRPSQSIEGAQTLVCPVCAHSEFYSPPIKPTSKMRQYRMKADSTLLDRVRSECEVDYPMRFDHDRPGDPTAMEVSGPSSVLRQFAERIKGEKS